jgi:hypothetical protein
MTSFPLGKRDFAALRNQKGKPLTLVRRLLKQQLR